ncbi:helix-turn-helix domain-containing protein [Mucilaginibacter achroorhodeus]|uniref:Helix-turn-helix domain-containing protein n=1 Tax=Mucilaginibacter achroorhodeus TaxID=2599294 RepID=A0A563U6N5_9SPHI|nr:MULTISPECIES: helix-turn-helix domain-containing protein [Mucilaginibacter]QXV64828.1 helix-turn-helix transcriptional regulator [Mucilaginibacter sp. 21P]TWR26969.1 helix-turn-helix domain-containing protein [Mucilaginibacter achroorhodeus]
MASTETLEEFYQNKFNWLPDNLSRDIGHFNVFRIEECLKPGAAPVQYSRREFYKISLSTGRSIVHHADKSIEVDGNTLLFFSPNVPYTIEMFGENRQGYFCIFTEAFFTESLRSSAHDLPMFAIGGHPAYELGVDQFNNAAGIFEKMLAEINSDYRFKYDLLRNYVTELIHYALKVQPAETLYKHPDANSRITAVFTELLERQFPIETPSQRFGLRSAKDFADQLSVHVNHLNRAIRQTTGKTTTSHIADRLVAEAKALLRHTNWNVSEISYTLGFDEPAHFNNFFKKQTNTTPSNFRIV